MTPDEVGAALFAAIEAGDIDRVRDLYDDDVVVWHNNDTGAPQGREDNLRTLSWCTRHIDGMRYEDVRRTAFDGGFVQQHLLRGRLADGTELSIPACIVAAVSAGGRITRIDEYLDSAHVAALFRR